MLLALLTTVGCHVTPSVRTKENERSSDLQDVGSKVKETAGSGCPGLTNRKLCSACGCFLVTSGSPN